MFPFVGHLGIATSQGTIHDFIGPYTINVCGMNEWIFILEIGFWGIGIDLEID